MRIDYRALDLKVGLEIHVQIASRRKLFCECPPLIKSEKPDFKIVRRLRVSLSELGQYDPAALFEFRRGKTYIYEGYNDCTCLVELDEEPPHEIDEFSLETALIVARMFNARVLDELNVMRKIVIDGSNVSGFQRTVLVAHDGLARFFQYKVPIWTICLEEDAARKIEETKTYVVYRLDRLGIPLVEVSTGPLQYSPKEVMEVAYYLGHSIKLTGRARRGVGTVRQDLNVSIRGGAKTEIKGISDLSLIPKVIEYEVIRQLNLLRIRDELVSRGVREEDVVDEGVDVTDVFANTRSNVVRSILREGGRVVAMRIPRGFAGVLGYEVQPGRRFGTELADYVRAWTDLCGIIHSDELPGYGISGDEVRALESKLGSSTFIIVMSTDDLELKSALNVLAERLRFSLKGVPEETRGVNADGTTRFERPRPGATRMYPETDLRPIRITIEVVRRAESKLPESIESIVNKYVSYGISRELANQVLRLEEFDLVNRLIERFRGRVPASVIATTFTSTLRSIRREGLDVSSLSEEVFDEIFGLLSEKVITKEVIPDILRELCRSPGRKVIDVVKSLNLERLGYDVVKRIVLEEISRLQRADLGRVISSVMSRFRGKVDVEDVKKAFEEVKSLLK